MVGLRKPVSLLAATALTLLVQSAAAPVARAAPVTVLVPGHHPTIQAAIDAVPPGSTVQVRAGTFTEQLRISKDLVIRGSGMDRTVVRAPATLVPGGSGGTSIVEIFDGATVSMSALTVRGPGSGTCEVGALNDGIYVHSEAHLDFSFGAVRDIHDTPMAGCFRSGNGITVGDVPDPPASITIRASQITNYQSAGIVVLGFGSVGTITHNIVTGPGHAGGVATDGIEFPVGSVGTISHNVVSGNVCPVGDESCGPDWFTQFQHAGILAGGWGPGTVVSNNYVFGNQIGLFLGEADDISNNHLIGNEYFGMGLISGTFRIDGGQIVGGGGGVWAIADSADTVVVLNRVTVARLSGPTVEELECCGFTATVTGLP